MNGVLIGPTAVTAVNHAPVITNTAAALAGAVTEDAALTTSGQLSATDVDAGATLTWSVQGAAVGTYGSLALNSVTGQWTYTLNNSEVVVQALAAGETHTENFTVRVTDDKGAFVNQTVVVTVNATNDAAIITGTSTASLTETDAALSTGGALAATDVDGSAAFAAQANVLGSNGYGVFAIDAAGAWTYSAGAHDEFAAGQSYTDSFTVATADGTEQVVTVTITGTNDAPVVTSGATASFAENDTGVVYIATATDGDAGTVLSFALGGADATRFNINAASGAVGFNTSPDFEAPADAGGGNVYDITVLASDGFNVAAARAVVISVTNVNEAPVANADTATINEDTVVNITALQNDTDVEGGALTVSAVTQGAHGAVSINGDGSLRYAPTLNYFGTDSFTYMASASGGLSSAATVNITINPVNDAPVLAQALTGQAGFVSQAFS